MLLYYRLVSYPQSHARKFLLRMCIAFQGTLAVLIGEMAAHIFERRATILGWSYNGSANCMIECSRKSFMRR